MEIRNELPPNIELIRTVLNPTDEAIFAYGETIYNPSGKELSADLILHESIHAKQQGENVEIWWHRYLTDPAFRLEQEIQAYGEQYLFVKSLGIRGKMLDYALESMARALSSASYGNVLSHGQAVSKIRNYSL